MFFYFEKDCNKLLCFDLKKVSDTRCPDESRLLQCQLVGGSVDSNINVATRLVFNYTFFNLT